MFNVEIYASRGDIFAIFAISFLWLDKLFQKDGREFPVVYVCVELSQLSAADNLVALAAEERSPSRHISHYILHTLWIFPWVKFSVSLVFRLGFTSSENNIKRNLVLKEVRLIWWISQRSCGCSPKEALLAHWLYFGLRKNGESRKGT